MTKKVLIFGLGLNQGGVGSAKFFAKRGDLVRVTDLKNDQALKPSLDQLAGYKIEYTLGEHKNTDIEWADLIIKNPGVKPGNPYIEYALKQDKRVEQDMGIFLEHVSPTQIIGVTGTKGKSTTASLIYEILSHTGHVILAGNIGRSVLESLDKIKPDTLVILELSSFQLESFDKYCVSPHWAVITNIYPDHLNYYHDMDEYTLAKKIIAKYQTKQDFLFLRRGDPITTQSEFLENIQSKIIYFSGNDLPQDFKSNLLGEHNLENISAAYQVGKAIDIDNKLLLESLRVFQGVPFRMQLIKTWNGVKIYNDTAATTPDAGIAAIRTGAKLFHPRCGIILIAGGMNKGMDYTQYAAALDEQIKKVYFLEGDSTEKIKTALINKSIIVGTYNNLEKLLSDVKNNARPGDIILFSPAATSFNMFQNEFDRGRKFNAAVEKIFI